MTDPMPPVPPSSPKDARAQARIARAQRKASRNWFMRHKILTGGAAVIVLIIIIAVASSGGGGGKNVPAAADTPVTTPAGQTAPTTSAPAKPAAKTTLLSTTGTGSKDTASFTAKGDWDINYTYDCSNLGFKGNFIVTVKGSDSNPSLANQGVNTLGDKGTDISHEHHGGTYYLSVLSECAWTISVTG